MKHLNHIDRAIIHFLGNRGASNTNQVSAGVRISWETTRRHLKSLCKRKYVKRTNNNPKRWEINWD